jgi:hypothetical protein
MNTKTIPSTPVADFDWASNNMLLRSLSCKSHPDLRWATKHIDQRNLHFLGHASGLGGRECPCPIVDLQVIG